MPRKSESENIFRVAIKFTDRKPFSKFLTDIPIDIGDLGPRTEIEGERRIEAYISLKVIEKIEKAGYDLEVLENLTETGLERQKEITKGDPFKDGKTVPEDLV